MAVSKRLRYEVLRRDDHACRYCGARAPEVKLTVDHVTPTALGGKDVPENLVAACAGCNSGKSSSSPDAPIVANVADDALRWAQAMQLAALRAQAHMDRNFKIVATLTSQWEQQMGEWASRDGYYLPADWEHSLFRFLEAGLTGSDLSLRMHYTLTRRNVRYDGMWRYFCGCCWRMLEERQDEAMVLIQDGQA